MEVVGHRGAGKLAPFNTTAAFSKARQMGLDASETDVWVTSDLRFVICHDELDETLTLPELEAATPELLLLEDVLTTCMNPAPSPPPLRLVLELKGNAWAGHCGGDIASKLVHLLSTHDCLPLVRAFSSFNHNALAHLRGLLPSVPRALLFNQDDGERGPLPADICEAAHRFCVNEIHIRYNVVTTAVMQQAHAAGLRVMAWFPGAVEEKIEDLAVLATVGVDAVCANRPDLALQARANVSAKEPAASEDEQSRQLDHNLVSCVLRFTSCFTTYKAAVVAKSWKDGAEAVLGCPIQHAYRKHGAVLALETLDAILWTAAEHAVGGAAVAGKSLPNFK